MQVHTVLYYLVRDLNQYSGTHEIIYSSLYCKCTSLQVDLLCVTAATAGLYYLDHLPLLVGESD